MKKLIITIFFLQNSISADSAMLKIVKGSIPTVVAILGLFNNKNR